jgi:hypothetical protein
MIELPGNKRVVAAYVPVVASGHKGSRRISALVLSGIANEPSVE